VSGIAAMQLSRSAKAGDVLNVDFCAGVDIDLGARARALPERRMEDFLNGILPKRIAQAVARAAGLPLAKRAGELSAAEIGALLTSLRAFALPVRGARGFDQAQATAGGLAADGFFCDTLEARAVPGLFAAGEVLDVDGPCGGYNLQWAWASGLLAAREIDKRLRA
jgi:predicted flavoprotein YhiN